MMTLKKKLLASAFAFAIGTSVAIPATVRADDWHHHDRDDQSWSRDNDHDRDHRDRDRDWDQRDRDHYRDYRDRERAFSFNHPGYGYNPNAGRSIPPNGEGMINNRNPNLYWACDSDGHHCHWARR